jgi:D-inositol-3-phosphate glycosyltransferase
MRSLAVLSMHTSPLAQPGSGDSGGMNVYVRELVGALAQAGVDTEVFVRRTDPSLPDVVDVEPGFRVVHIDAGPFDLPKEDLPDVLELFGDGVAARMRTRSGYDAIHANYWLSGVVGHRLKHELSLPLVSTFHTLARVKAETGDDEPQRRIDAETKVIACSDAILANCAAEVTQLVELYGADPSRVEIVPPGVDHAFFSPGDRNGARLALELGDHPVLLFAGRIQPLKGLTIAIAALAELDKKFDDAVLVVVGGPSGAEGDAELDAARSLINELGLGERVRFVPPQPHHLLSTYYRAADVCVVPSRSESFGLVALEAAACGTPVVAAAVGGLLTLVEDGVTGFLIDTRNPSDYATAIDKLLGDKPKSLLMDAAAADYARQYTWSTTAARLRRLYADLTLRAPVSCD